MRVLIASFSTRLIVWCVRKSFAWVAYLEGAEREQGPAEQR
jgi:hypothetical protein